ncbi:hypothetical protein LOTGIDRAFT_152859 [Lottia gigantea]|uniref:Uncharacterized protein n=1 Tax=Lottia gigantea TaxID=225164 RepID=V4A1Q6_LOTGI|nr:hypothetical protein LOTGIDRAFT_152859 [Lottia gigantea]ESO97763.1 hypothetical protein LOTGIDRAFT_152859 [Lottia gigantea]
MRKLMILLVTLTDISIGLQRCSDTWLDFKGYTYSVDPVSKKRIWSHCKFPNPTADSSRCGFPVDTSRPGYICDPDGIISSSNNAMIQINQQLIAIQKNTSTLCDSTEKQRQSYIVSIALIDEMRIADLQDASSCINDCNEIQPTLNTTVRQPTEGEVDKMVTNFADSLRVSWALGACDNDVVIFYSKHFNKVYTSVGSKASSFLSESKLAALHSSFLENVNNGKLEDGLLLLVDEVRTNLRSFTPAHILVVVNVVIIVLVVLFFTFFLHMSDVELNVWGNEKQWAVLDIIIKFITGVWFLNFMFLGIGNTLYRLNIWASLVCLAAAIGCIVIVYEHDVIFTSRSTVTNFNLTA